MMENVIGKTKPTWDAPNLSGAMSGMSGMSCEKGCTQQCRFINHQPSRDGSPNTVIIEIIIFVIQMQRIELRNKIWSY